RKGGIASLSATVLFGACCSQAILHRDAHYVNGVSYKLVSPDIYGTDPSYWDHLFFEIGWRGKKYHAGDLSAWRQYGDTNCVWSNQFPCREDGLGQADPGI